MRDAITKKIELILFISIFLFLIPFVSQAKDCSHCWCLISPDKICEHHTKEDGTTGQDITTQEQCSNYCFNRSTDAQNWNMAHCDDSYIDWNSKDPGDPCFANTTTTPSDDDVKVMPFQAVEPRLSIPEIDLKYSAVLTQEGDQRYITVPYLAEYIASLYQYLVGIATILATIMIMYGGFRWVTAAGSPDKIGEAKKTIVGAVIGLALALGSYTVLNLINPDLVTFKALRLAVVEEDIFDAELDKTKVNTMEPTEELETEVTPAEPPTPTFEDCPISLTASLELRSPSEARSEEFKEKIMPFITGETTREQIIQIAEAVAKCGVHFGSCGKTVKTINALAGIKGRGQKTHSISNAQMNYLDTINCEKGSPKSCYSNAKKTAYDKFKNEISGNWPDSWANELQPGDAITVFNANSSEWGTHAAIFMGWQGSKAKVIQGSYKKIVKEGTICIKSGCAQPQPLVRTFKPE